MSVLRYEVRASNGRVVGELIFTHGVWSIPGSGPMTCRREAVAALREVADLSSREQLSYHLRSPETE